MPETETGAAVLEVARSLRARILAERDRIEASRRLPDDIARELSHAGFFRIFLPAAYGGLDLTPMEGLEIFEELARADASVAWCVWNGNTHWIAAQLLPEAAQTIHAAPEIVTANTPALAARLASSTADSASRADGRWSAAANSAPGWCCCARSTKTGSRA